MRVLVYLEKAEVRGGIEVFAERHVAQLRAAGHEVDVVHSPSAFNAYDEIIVHKCSDVATLEVFPPEKTTYYVHDHEPICPRTYAYTPLRRNCTRASGVWPCLFCAPLCRSWKAALARVFAQGRRKRVMARMRMPRTLDVVGTGNMEAELKAQAERLGLVERVRWHGYQPNPQDWMRAAKCVVVPSFWQEPYGLVAAEAVALGRSVVAFDIGGLPEACGGKATLVPPGDVDALARALDDAGACTAEMV